MGTPTVEAHPVDSAFIARASIYYQANYELSDVKAWKKWLLHNKNFRDQTSEDPQQGWKLITAKNLYFMDDQELLDNIFDAPLDELRYIMYSARALEETLLQLISRKESKDSTPRGFLCSNEVDLNNAEKF